MAERFNLFVDMDGTVARFYEHSNCLEAMYESGFFRCLNAYPVMAAVIKACIIHPDIRVIFHSTVPKGSEFGAEDKAVWLSELFFDTPDYEVILRYSPSNKAFAAQEWLGRELTDHDILFDDYSKNLREWGACGGSCIKCVNEIQDAPDANSWQGIRISVDEDVLSIEQKLYAVFGFFIDVNAFMPF